MMWRPNRTTVFKDGSNISDSEADFYFERKKHFNISLDLIILDEVNKRNATLTTS